MFSRWLSFLAFISSLNLIEVSDSSAAHRWSDLDNPTCEELRSFWKKVTLSEEMSASTNEIPLMPRLMLPDLNKDIGMKNGFGIKSSKSLQKTLHGRKERPNSLKIYPGLQNEPFFFPMSQDSKATHSFGAHTDIDREYPIEIGQWQTSFPSSSTKSSQAPTGTKKNMGESDIAESWGRPEEVGMFGKFIDFDEDWTPLLTPNDGINSWPYVEETLPFHEVLPESCVQVLNKPCINSEQCKCAGWKILECLQATCTYQHLNAAEEEQYGSWHNGPLPHSELGLVKRLRKRRNKPNFM